MNELPPGILENSQLLIVGEAWEDTESLRSAASSPAASHITLVNRYVEDQEVPAYFSAADVLVIPYTRASQSGVAHIGMAFGLPIVASDVGGLSESLRKYRGTVFVRPEETGELAESLVRVISDPGVFEPPEELRWEKTADRWRMLIQGVLK